MELKDLSSNWKKLQQTLRKDRAPKSAKHHLAEDVQRDRAKRRKHNSKKEAFAKFQEKAPTKEHSMGLGTSKATSAAPSASLALWAEDNDIPARDLTAAYGSSLKSTSRPPAKDPKDCVNIGLSSDVEAGRYIAIDCEMVGVGPTPDIDSALARVSLVNYHGEQLYDSFVLPKEAVTDYRTFVSGITPQLLKSARPLEDVQRDVAGLMQGKVLVGHAIRNDLKALFLGHPERDIRDTSRYPRFRALAKGRTPALKRLAKELLGVEIQGGEHSSVEDARATMLLFRREKDGFEHEHTKKWGISRIKDGDMRNSGDGADQKRRKRKKVRK
ncbi:3'-5' exonuclease [Lambiella insularis]|nr:3'-5' exonuclease [Lambiella insularis]